MAKTKSEIHEFHAARKLNILKGFSETSFNPPVHIQKLKETHGEENVYTLEMLKGYTDSALEKGDVSSILSAQDDLSALTAVAGINERGIKQTFYIEKGKKALVGEVRTWKGKKYRKKANGKWERVVETVTRDYVDEDTGEIYSITHEVEPEKSHEEEMRELEMRHDGNKTRQRKQRKADRKEKKVAEKRRDLEYDLDAMAEEYQDLKRELKQLDSDMNAEAGMMGEKWNDDKANEYGGKMMEVEAKMEALIPQIKKLKVEIENYEEKEARS